MDNLPGETLEDTFEIRGSRLTDDVSHDAVCWWHCGDGRQRTAVKMSEALPFLAAPRSLPLQL